MAFLNFIRQRRKTNLLNLLIRILQLIDGLVIIGLYATDLNKAHQEDKYTDGKWVRSKGSIPPEFARLTIAVQVYAVVVGSCAAATAVCFSIASMVLQYSTVAVLFLWEWVLVILFAALSGIFGSMYINEQVEMESGIRRMKIAVGFDLTGLALFVISASVGTYFFFRGRRDHHIPKASVG